MSKTFRHIIGVLVLLAGAALVTACRSSSDKDQSKATTEAAHSKVAAGEPAMHVASKATHAQAKAHAKAEPGSKERHTSTQPAGKQAPVDPLDMTP